LNNYTLSRYRRYGKGYHFAIDSVQDLADAATLDDALWVATAAPIDSFRIDPIMLQLLDTNKDLRITAGEVKQAINWTLKHLRKQDGIQRGDTALTLEHIETSAPDGQAIADALRKIMPPGDTRQPVTLSQVRRLKSAIEQQPISGSGVILPDAGQDQDITQFLKDIIACTGGAPHPGGTQGVNDNALATFQEQARQYIQWVQAGLLPNDDDRTPIKPYGTKTADAYTVFNRLQDKFEQFFIQCQAVQLDPELLQRLWPRDAHTAIEDTADTQQINALLQRASLSRPNPDAHLDFNAPCNPVYADDLAAFQRLVLRDQTTMTAAQWRTIKATFSPYREWLTQKPGNMFDTLGLEKLEQYLDEKYTTAVRELISRSRDSSIALDQLCLAEKLALFQGGLMNFVNNFISMPDLYAPDRRALFEEGTLIMDGRHFNLCIRVFDRKEHVSITEKGVTFIMYLLLQRSAAQPQYEIAVPVAAGTRGGLVEGKRGIFHHVDGTEWNARIVQIVDKPISLTEATLAPFSRLSAAVTGRIEALSGSAAKDLEKAGADSVNMIDQAAREQQPTVVAAAPPANANLGGTLAGAGVAVAALGSSFAFILKMIASIKNWWQLAGGIAAAILAVLIPTLIIAIIRLRRRDIKNLLEGSGWAINVTMRLSRQQKKYITSRPAKPVKHTTPHAIS
jgi:hypothetical protein